MHDNEYTPLPYTCLGRYRAEGSAFPLTAAIRNGTIIGTRAIGM